MCSDKEKNCMIDTCRGCRFTQHEEETSASACPGCFKLHSSDWLKEFPNLYADDIFEVRFKNTRRGYFKNSSNIPLKQGDIVAVEASPGHDIGIISLTGDIVRRQMIRVGFNSQNGEFKKIYRKAKAYDIEKWQEAIALEHQTMIRARQIADELNLNMKIGDVEYQGDKIKAIFYYIADERVDFRELIKIFAEQFRIRVEMKQIGARQEAGRIGGLGSCGRELCCASWISNFVSVTTNAARNQEISLNPQKLAGQCGKLKCCLMYEVDTYLDARKEFPKINQPLQTIEGDYFLIKSDILNRSMWFSTDPHSQSNMVLLSLDRVKEVLKLNQKGVKVEQLNDISEITAEEPTFANVVGEESLTRFDQMQQTRRKNRKKRKNQPFSDQEQPLSANRDQARANQPVLPKEQTPASEENQKNNKQQVSVTLNPENSDKNNNPSTLRTSAPNTSPGGKAVRRNATPQRNNIQNRKDNKNEEASPQDNSSKPNLSSASANNGTKELSEGNKQRYNNRGRRKFQNPKRSNTSTVNPSKK